MHGIHDLGSAYVEQRLFSVEHRQVGVIPGGRFRAGVPVAAHAYVSHRRRRRRALRPRSRLRPVRVALANAVTKLP
jgi:hypothetical protein